jgi:sugar phosphate isomerase/epimerase
MRCAVTVSLVPEAIAGPFVFHGDLEFACATAAKLGFDAIELFPSSGSALDPRLLRQVLHRTRIDLAAAGTGAGWLTQRLSLTSPEVSTRLQAQQFIASIVDFAGAFGAPAVIGSMQGRLEPEVTRAQAMDWLAQALELLGPRAEQYAVPLLLEPLNRYETDLFNTLKDVAEFLGPLRTRNIRLLADLFHMNIEEASIPDALRAAGPLIGHVHFADSNRNAAGMGHTDFHGIVAALNHIGFKGYLSAEVFPRPSSEEAARTTLKTLRQIIPPVSTET